MVKFVGDQDTFKQAVIDIGIKGPDVGTIDIVPKEQFKSVDQRNWISFPLVMTPEFLGGNKAEWLKKYPRLITWTDNKVYVFVGTHTAQPEYGIKGDNVAIYKEILVAKGEPIEYISY